MRLSSPNGSRRSRGIESMADPPAGRTGGAMLDPSAHIDGFARAHLPPPEAWPVFDTGGLAELQYPQRLNAAVELLDRMVEKGFGPRPCLWREIVEWKQIIEPDGHHPVAYPATSAEVWSYAD